MNTKMTIITKLITGKLDDTSIVANRRWSDSVYRSSSRGGTIHRYIDISRYFSRDTYRDIIFYNRNDNMIISTCDFGKVIPQIHSYFVKSVETN